MRVLTVPNLLTILRIILILIFTAASLRSQFDLAFWLFVTAGVTDVIDGYIARRFNQRSRLGAILDPAADKMMMLLGIIVFTFFPHVDVRLPRWLAFTMFARDFLIVLFAYMLYTRIQIRRFPPSIPGKISTLAQVVVLSAAIACNTSFAATILPIFDPLARIALAATLYSGFDYLRRTDALLREG